MTEINDFYKSFTEVKRKDYTPEPYVRKMHSLLEDLGYPLKYLLDMVTKLLYDEKRVVIDGKRWPRIKVFTFHLKISILVEIAIVKVETIQLSKFALQTLDSTIIQLL